MSDETIVKKDDTDSNSNQIEDEEIYIYIDRRNVGLFEGAYFIFMIFFSQFMWKVFGIKM